MTVHYLKYALHNGFIHNWLVAGPQAIAVSDLDSFQEQDFKSQIVRHFYQKDSGITAPPIERATFSVGETELRWDYDSCLDDHFVDLSCFFHLCHRLRAWAYAEIFSPEAQRLTLTLTSNGPADIWLNGQHSHRQEQFQHQAPYSTSTEVTLQPGRNAVLVRFEVVATRECPFVMALHISGANDHPTPTFEALPVRIPIDSPVVERRQQVEQLLAHAYIERDIYSHDQEVRVVWPDNPDSVGPYAARVQSPANRIYGEANTEAQPDTTQSMAQAYQLSDDSYNLVLMASLDEYYRGNVRASRKLPFRTMKNRYSDRPYGSFQERRLEALKDAALREVNVYSEMAKMALGWWSQLKPDHILSAIEAINQRQDCSDFYLVGLLGILYRFGDEDSFPQEIKQALEACILGFKYWADEPGRDSMWYWSENHQILFHTCEILAGQYYPDRVFGNNGQTGRWHRDHGEQLALTWLKKRALAGFQEWDSNCYFEHDLLALAHLLDMADTDEIWETAAIVMDKMFLTIALNSYKGVFGSTHGRSYTSFIKSGYEEATAGVCRLMWGTGIFNQHILGTVSLACTQNYELPEVIAAIATDPAGTMWSKERHAGEFDPAVDAKSGSWAVNKVTYRTPDYMLCSAQDYHPGTEGYQQHIWQATLGPEAVVFVNHPPCLSEEGAHRPGAWHGNVVLPRVAQWQDTLVAIHKLPDDDWLGFTHAYFPTPVFDETNIRNDWAFARKGEGYLALTAAQGIDLIKHGPNAYRELRSHGQNNIWLCQMGRKSTDGTFVDFQEQVRQTKADFSDLSVSYTTLHNDTLQFGWEDRFLINEQAQPLRNFNHYDGPYAAAEWPASILAIGFGHDLLRLKLSDEAAESDRS